LNELKGCQLGKIFKTEQEYTMPQIRCQHEFCQGTGEYMKADCAPGYHREVWYRCEDCVGEGSVFIDKEELFQALLMGDIKQDDIIEMSP